MQRDSRESGGIGGCLVRLLWMAVGNVILVLVAVSISQHQVGFALTMRDAFFWGTVLGLLAVRYVDIRYLGGETADNRPASMADWRRYAVLVVGVALALWLGVHALS